MVWKSGKKPNFKKIEEFCSEENIVIIFYNRKRAYIANLFEVTYEEPESDFPDYYKEQFWRPSSWYRIQNLLELYNFDLLNNLMVKSSGSIMSEALNSSMTSFYFAIANKTLELRSDKNA